MIDRASRFFHLMTDWLGQGGKPVERGIAQSRANGCLKCPLNQKLEWWRLWEVGAVITARRLISLKSSMDLVLDEEENLRSCKSCDCILRLKVWVPMEHIKNTTDLKKLAEDCEKAKATCWILE